MSTPPTPTTHLPEATATASTAAGPTASFPPAGAVRGQIEARTPAGRRLVTGIEQLTPAFAERARRNDASAEYPYKSLVELRDQGMLRAPIPTELGGLGVESVHDLVVAASRVARGDASLAIGVNMHLVVALGGLEEWRGALDAGDASHAETLAASLARIAESGVAIAAAVSEPGPQDLSRPATTARRVDDGWRIDGVKAFCTMSPAADLLSVAVSYDDDLGRQRYGFALVGTRADGVTVHDDWDALGMRSSGSGRVTLEGVIVGSGAIADSHPAGETSAAALDRFLTSGLFHASATLGISEAAHQHVLGRHAASLARIAAGSRGLQQVADNTVDLGAMRAVLVRAADAVDAYRARDRQTPGGHPLDEAADVFAHVQAAKATIDRAGVCVVDRALELSGGAGYLTASPLSQAYRDVRAGAFMHPLGANRASDFIARVELGLTPELQ